MNTIDTVLFDFDGTVMDTNDLIYNSWQYTYRTVTGEEGDPEFIYSTYGEILQSSMAKAFPNIDVDKTVSIYREYQKDNYAKQIRLFPKIKETIAAIKQQGYKQALVTSRLREKTMEGVTLFGIDRYFDTIVTMEDTKAHKPNPGPILKALERLDSKGDQAIMVGDSQYDLLCAHNAGVEYAMVAWTKAGEAVKKQGLKPDYVMKEAADILDILARRENGRH